MASKLTTQQFIEKANKVHNNKYDYSKVEYKNSRVKIKIICPTHGEFEQTPSSHLNARGCLKCSNNIKLTTQQFIEKANKVHNNKYDYSKVEYKNSKTKVKIICPIHGEFEQRPNNHFDHKGCYKCFTQNITSSMGIFIEKANKVHSNKYDYSKVEYKNSKTKVKIICPTHNEFEQIPSSHLNGKGCNECNKITTDIFIEKANKVHNNKYDYSKVEYKHSKEKVKIICPIHGEFKQPPAQHLCGHGCSKCNVIISSGHKNIIAFIKSIGLKHNINDRVSIKPLELDIYIPDRQIAIEFNGLYWHSFDRVELPEERNKHSIKCDLCQKKEIQLIQINENEWKNKQEIVKSVIKSKLGLSNRIYARKCKIKDLNNEQYKEFIDKYHLQGHKTASIKYGLEYNDELVAVMSFNKHPKYQWEITRFANKLNMTVVGGASKLFKHFLREHNPDQILTYADRRYSNGNLYKKLGFKLDGITQPNYIYIKNKKIFSRQQFQKHKLKDKLEDFNPLLTEAENMFNNGYRRMWDAGNYRFLLK